MKSFFIFFPAIILSISISAQNGKLPSAIPYLKFENRADIPNAPNCNPSETYLKKKVKALVAAYYPDYPEIAVDITSFKGQKGYSDKKIATKILYPFKIEMFVYLKRKIIKEGKEYNEYTTWEHDSVYEYVTQRGKKCSFYELPSSDKKFISREVF